MKGHTRRDEKEQPTLLPSNIQSARELKPGDRVVYPNQGVCRVVGLEQKDIAGQRLEMVRMRREEDGAAVLVPMAKVSSVGLRRVSTAAEIDSVFHFLAAVSADPELDWKVRHRDNVERLIAGGVLGVAEVVKGLHSLSRIRPLPTKEREQYDGARHLLVSEVAVALGVPGNLAEDYVDYALNPPAGTRFQLKPPPKPIEISIPAYRRKKPAAAEEEELGLEELGIELPEEGGAGEGEAGAEGEEAAAKAGQGAAEAAGKGERPPKGAKPAAARPARKAAPRPRAKVARKPAPRKKAARTARRGRRR
ncbi:MAG TPA: CarD family transcriptional regulator [Anaeromyxobacteraceae bacterium]|nr:CarD family transcriptional regulator [Anaeromyxobacteraceae bacterium]